MDRIGDASAWTAAGAERAAGRFRLLEPLLAALRHGRLRLRLPNGAALASSGDESGVDATITIDRWRAFRRLAFGGDVGFAESYIDGDWSSPDPVALLRLLVQNADTLRDVLPGSSIVRLANRLRHRVRGNTRRGSRRNIMAHYDLGNDFYALWLDREMQYSSGVWRDGDDLESAQAAKLARIEDLLALKGGERVLEIGCGWGGLALRLAAGAGARVTALTLSPAQLAHARACAQASGRDVDFRLQDYRDVTGRYDRIVSIEMIEAVGEARWPLYFRTLADALAPSGRAVLQAITIDERLEDDYRRNPDFIQKHIFPGGRLPTKSAIEAEARRAGLRIVHREFFGPSYARTLAEWRRRFHARWPDVETLGFDTRFRRLWDYYLAYCEAGFAEATIDVGLFALEPA
ncbi:cyclopropane-fatty-acyl-phospholipid synthase [Roseiarcus fermentans]|uniref:Cyclopropane-fatty-acyl-phospholipid synthase n=1 Tax=Roseiarcus fermentans TaxID=1473586 RepID=A0A366F5B4_9HYPH|nr:cyclopropane-fatty-acyl-phospholipid synthase family protein [Roseiarcus fermentans]RBP09833.1 cyclopropane-fatty-acyl-phospholipid synthase [Roseiarcus fermentans]